jgi:UDP-N-acetylglucosamine acyltransferase
LAYTSLIGPLEIGNNNRIGPNAIVGTPGQDTREPRYDASRKRIKIGDNNIIREFTGVQKPCYEDLTSLGNDVFLMQSVHIPHDAILEDKVVVTPMVALAGLVRILEGASISMGSMLHQYTVIGQYSIVGMGSTVMKNVKPFSRYIPGKPMSLNEYAIRKFGFEPYREELLAYVIDAKAPTSERIGRIIEHYERLHTQSKRPQY